MWRIDMHSKCENVCSALYVLVCCTVLGGVPHGRERKGGGLFKSFGFFVDHEHLSEERARRSVDMGCYGIYIYIYVYVICIEWIYAFHTVQITSYEGGKH